ncbi:unnamed protein product [Lepidochelys kempii]
MIQVSHPRARRIRPARMEPECGIPVSSLWLPCQPSLLTSLHAWAQHCLGPFGAAGTLPSHPHGYQPLAMLQVSLSGLWHSAPPLGTARLWGTAAALCPPALTGSQSMSHGVLQHGR